jgi:HlyD family secretion protein
METELKSLKIDRSARHERESGPVLKLIIIAVIVALAAMGAVFAYNKLNAPVPVQVVQVQSPTSASSAGNQMVLTATGYIIAAHKIEVASKVNGRVAWIGVSRTMSTARKSPSSKGKLPTYGPNWPNSRMVPVRKK